MAFDIIGDWLRCPLNAGKANFHLKRKMRKDMQNRFIEAAAATAGTVTVDESSGDGEVLKGRSQSSSTIKFK